MNKYQSFQPDAPYAGLLTFLLPPMEQSNVYDPIAKHQLRVPDNAGQTRWFTETTLHNASQVKLPLYTCPSTNPYDYDRIISRTTMWMDVPRGTGWLTGRILNDTDRQYGRTNYLGVAGFLGSIPYFEDRRGIFGNRTEYQFRDITDGTSNTLMLGEAVGDESLKLAHSWMGSNFLPTAFGFGRKEWNQFNSQHVGVSQFALADGSVRALSVNINRQLYQQLSTMGTGEVTGEF